MLFISKSPENEDRGSVMEWGRTNAIGTSQKWQEWTGCPGNGRSGRPTPPGAKFSQLCNQAAVKGSGSKVRVPDFHSGFACFASVDAPVPKCPKWENA